MEPLNCILCLKRTFLPQLLWMDRYVGVSVAMIVLVRLQRVWWPQSQIEGFRALYQSDQTLQADVEDDETWPRYKPPMLLLIWEVVIRIARASRTLIWVSRGKLVENLLSGSKLRKLSRKLILT